MSEPMMSKGEFYRDRDRYMFEPFEEAFFHWGHSSRTIHMKFVGDNYGIEVPHNHRILTAAILTGREVAQADYERGAISD